MTVKELVATAHPDKVMKNGEVEGCPYLYPEARHAPAFCEDRDFSPEINPLFLLLGTDCFYCWRRIWKEEFAE